MKRFAAILVLILAPLSLSPMSLTAQDRDSVFNDYADYSDYVDRMITTREFIPFIQRMGGRDEYTKEQLAGVNGQLLSIFRKDFRGRAVFRAEKLGGGIRHESRAYWGPNGYVYLYVIMHERPDALVVLNFALNTKLQKIMDKY